MPNASHIPKSERILAARALAHERWAKERDRTKATQPARDGWLAKLEDEIDPNHELSAEERRRRALNLRRAREPSDSQHPLGEWLVRAITGASGAGAAFTPAEFPATFFDRPAAATVGLRSGFRVVTTERDSVVFPRWTGDTAAAWTAEGANITATDATADTVTATPRKLAGLQQIANETLDDSNPSLYEVIAMGLVRSIALKADLGFFEGSLALDGSFSQDATVVVACTVEEKPHFDLVQIWENPDPTDETFRIPVIEVEDAIRAACRRWRVREVTADPYRWQRSLQVLGHAGITVSEFPQSPSRMTPATTGLAEAVANQAITHSGSPVLARHISAAQLKVDARGTRLAKEHKHSTRRIDAAVALCMAYDRARHLAGRPRAAIHILD